MKKTFIHQEKKFQMTLRLNAEVERRMGGKRIHKLDVVSEDEAEGFSETFDINDKSIEEDVRKAEKACIYFCDNGIPSLSVQTFIACGFK